MMNQKIIEYHTYGQKIWFPVHRVKKFVLDKGYSLYPGGVYPKLRYLPVHWWAISSGKSFLKRNNPSLQERWKDFPESLHRLITRNLHTQIWLPKSSFHSAVLCKNHYINQTPNTSTGNIGRIKAGLTTSDRGNKFICAILMELVVSNVSSVFTTHIFSRNKKQPPCPRQGGDGCFLISPIPKYVYHAENTDTPQSLQRQSRKTKTLLPSLSPARTAGLECCHCCRLPSVVQTLYPPAVLLRNIPPES